MFAELASLLFYSRDYAHRAHLFAATHAQHVVLDEFYKEVTELIDALIEIYQGRNGKIAIPVLEAEDDLSMPKVVMLSHLSMIERFVFNDRPLDAALDDVTALYLRTLYKLNLS